MYYTEGYTVNNGFCAPRGKNEALRAITGRGLSRARCEARRRGVYTVLLKAQRRPVKQRKLTEKCVERCHVNPNILCTKSASRAEEREDEWSIWIWRAVGDLIMHTHVDARRSRHCYAFPQFAHELCTKGNDIRSRLHMTTPFHYSDVYVGMEVLQRVANS